MHAGGEAGQPVARETDCTHLRVAGPADIPALMRVRLSVHENRLSDPARVSEDDYRQHMERLGRTWVVERAGEVVAFAAGRVTDGEIWALFVDPRFEGQGVGSRLHAQMVAWLFAQGLRQLQLGTSPGTRAEAFYRRRGWTDDPTRAGGDEVRLVLDVPATTTLQQPAAPAR